MLLSAEKFSPYTSFTSFDLSFGSGSDHEPPHPPGWVFGPTTTKHYIIEYVHSGRGVMNIDNELHPLKAGDVLILLPWQVRTYQADEHDPWGFSWVNISGKSADSFFELAGITKDNYILRDCENTQILPLIEQIINIIKLETQAQRIFRAGSLVLSLFDEIWQAARTRNNLAHTTIHDGYVARAAKYMEVHLGEKTLTVDSISHSLGLNRSYLYKLFKSELNMSPQEYLMQLRIRKGVELLTMSDTKITTIAYSVGYEPLIFTKVFKRYMGMTPSEYRKKNAINQN